ncbi:hypothetical protein SAMN02745146_0105 [Hymenobacter daecheongensis DSM 21074]|uniref:Uncharacterized protein n=1 Tax=Hymenobacter daecheongensis DSM 21074 TaxID=1121955 RepID=A0A1M6LYS1_9BACT|nr:hypothetical protein [Hymenobacter daecheongensis]SHJ76322.1 hypothetical protein SAMN02745146_0105 [Hymenobacter daecheongensis DSM 21074]
MAVHHHYRRNQEAPRATAPQPLIRFNLAGPGQSTITKTGQAVTGMVTAQGQSFLGEYDVTTVLAPELGNVPVLRCGYGASLFQPAGEYLPDTLYGDHARHVICYAKVPLGFNREVLGWGDTGTRQAFDLVSLLADAASSNYGIGIHQIANDGIKPQVPPRATERYVKYHIKYLPQSSGTQPQTGILSTLDGLNSDSIPLNLTTGGGLENPNRKGLRIGLGVNTGGLGGAAPIYIAHVEIHDRILTAAEELLHDNEWDPVYGYAN